MTKNFTNFLIFVRTYIRPYRATQWFIVISLLLQAIFVTALPFSFKLIIDELGANAKQHLIWTLSALLIGVVVMSIVGIAKDLLYARFIANFIRDIRLILFEHLQKLPMKYFQQSKIGDITTYFTTDLAAIEDAANIFVSGVIASILSFLCNMVLLAFLDWRLLLVALLIWPALLIGPKKFATMMMKENLKQRSQGVQLLGLTQENIAMQSVIKSFSLAEYLSGVFSTANQVMTKLTFRVSFFTLTVARWGETIPVALQLLALSGAAYLAYNKNISIAALVAFYMSFTTLVYALIRITYSAANLIQGMASIQRVSEFLAEAEIVDDKNLLVIEHFDRAIDFKNTHFSFAGNEPILRRINCQILRGKKVAFVGPSGSGKSTILKLIMRFYDATNGVVSIDGKNLSDVSRFSLRQLIGYVAQEPLLFHATIRQNIQFGKLDASFEEIQEAAEAAEIHDTIMSMPQGYDTVLSDRGDNLSGGQKQRIAIARMIVRSPEILILDETTSALDPSTEASINATLERLAKGRTSISVTHRLDSVVDADNIFVLNQGRIVEDGNHESLMLEDGFYKQLWDKQHGFIINKENDEVKITLDRLQAIPLFKNLPVQLVEQNIHLLRTVSVPENRTIMEQGDIGNTFYIIVHGRVGIFQEKAGETKRIAILEDGDYFGEIALLKEIPRTATVKAITPCLFLTLYRRDFINLLNENPGIREQLERNLLERELAANGQSSVS